MELRAGYKQTEVGVIPADWGLCQVGSLANYVNGKAHEQSISDSGKFVVVNSRFISTEGEVRKYSDECFCPTQPDDVLMVMSDVPNGRAIAKCFYVEEMDTYTVNQRICILSPTKIEGKLLFYKLNRNKFYLSFDDGVKQTNLRKSDVLSCPLGIPNSRDEQRAIATALTDVDALLAAQDKLIAKKRDIKQAAIQQLLTGKQRLPGFSGEWEVKQLGDVGTCLRGVSYKGDADLFPHDTEDTRRLLRSNNVQDAMVVTSDIQFVNRARVSEQQVMQDNDILICMANGSKALVGKAGLFKPKDSYEYTFGAFMGCFRTNSVIANPVFVFFLFQTGQYRNYINNLLAGSSINNLKPSSIDSLEFPFPKPLEQAAIAAVLSDMDAEFAAMEKQRDKTRSLKQGMMQELLTGRIRLI